MLQKNVFHVNKKVDVVQKKFSCWEKQNDAAQKSILRSKKVLTFSESTRHTTYIADVTSMTCNAVAYLNHVECS